VERGGYSSKPEEVVQGFPSIISEMKLAFNFT
jgi:hypothetical protein